MNTENLIKTIAGGNPDTDNIRSVVEGLKSYGVKAGLDQRHRFAHFIAQLAHESARFKYDREIWGPTPAQRRYEDRVDLGHSRAVSNEAFTFRGRSGIQLTGRYNYKRFTEWCRKHFGNTPDFEKQPDLINTDPWEGLVPIWYWDVGNPTGKSLNVYADSNNAEAVTRKINGGLNGYTDRLELYVRSALVLLDYKLEEGVVRKFQMDAGFSPLDVDDIPGMQTRGSLHRALRMKQSLTFGRAVATTGATEDVDDKSIDVRDEFALDDNKYAMKLAIKELRTALTSFEMVFERLK